jgi:CTP-dependent riboflavin kinase
MKNELEMLETLKKEQNNVIAELSRSTDNLKSQCEDIDEELEVHNFLLGSIENLTDKNEVMMQKALERLDKILERYSNSSLMCTIFILLTILIVIVLL